MEGCEYGRKWKFENCEYKSTYTTYRYDALNTWNIMDLYDDGIYNNEEYKENTKLYFLYKNIKNKDWLDNADTYLYYKNR